MTRTYAFYRLAWRPMMLVWGALLVGVGGFAHVAIVLPMMAGFIAGRMTKEVQHGLFSWTPPGLRRSFAAGMIPLALLTTLPAAIVFARAAAGHGARSAVHRAVVVRGGAPTAAEARVDGRLHRPRARPLAARGGV